MTPDELDFEKGGGRVTVIAQHAQTGQVLMVAAADREAIMKTLQTGEMHYTSRTRGLWHKGATSGNVQRVIHLDRDCDGDAVLAQVIPAGPACHQGTASCFQPENEDANAPVHGSVNDPVPANEREREREREANPTSQPAPAVLAALDATLSHRQSSPTPTSYTHRLLTDRNHRLKKLGEESAELVLACADQDPARIAEEAADLLYHLLVACRAEGVSLSDIEAVLARRAAPQPSSSNGKK